jgi:hypothetical protein
VKSILVVVKTYSLDLDQDEAKALCTILRSYRELTADLPEGTNLEGVTPAFVNDLQDHLLESRTVRYYET